MIGKTLSHYKVLEKIGQGGMGEVYRAEDTSLKRQVAIKVLPEQFTKDPQRLARFEREAQLLASLNHPNIAAIYGLEEADGVRFLALELVEGETLAERVAKGPVPVEEALEICRQIAQGVEAAHEKGVIHRDLKPANVKVTPEGKVKILDFGLAKAFEGETPVTDISQSPTLTEEMTRAGVILGTAAYMSPEQAKGKEVNKQADIFAFGAVLYELLTGKRAFEGETITETIAAVLKSEPDWESLPKDTPWKIRELVEGCLEKDTHNRLHDVANVRIQIKKAVAEPTTVSPVGVTSSIQSRLWRRAIPWSITAVVIVIAGISIWSFTGSTSQPLLKLDMVPLSTAPLADLNKTDLAISPDGKRIVYAAEIEGATQLYVRSLDELIATPIPGTEGVNGNPVFSPDGRSLTFLADGGLKKVLISGGPVITLSEFTDTLGDATWESDDTVMFSNRNTLYRVSAAGGEPEILAVSNAEKGEGNLNNPLLLPNGRDLLVTAVLRNSRREIRVLSLETGDQRTVVEGRHPRYLPTGHLIYEPFLTGILMAIPFNLTTLKVSGQPVPVVEGVRTSSPGDVDYDVSENGTLTYVSGSANPDNILVWVDREGRTESVIQRRFNQLQLSPDGQYVAITVGFDVWVYEMARGILTPLTFGDRQYRAPIWTPDGERLTFTGGRGEGIFWIPTAGSGEMEQLTVTESSNTQIPGSWSPDNILAYSEGPSPQGVGDIWVLSPEGDGNPREFLVNEFYERHPMFSPDGQWIAFTSDRSGQDEIYVTAYPNKGGVVQISTDGGNQPLWARDGKELFYRNGDRLMAVSVQTEPTFKAETPVFLFEGTYFHGPFNRTSNYDISLDGQRFLMIKEEREIAQIHVVLNWFEELKRLVPTDR